jgi:glutamine amidotransferase-like uncharacterized protein
MKIRAALFLHAPKCSIESGNGIIRCLHNVCDFKVFSNTELYPDFFDDVDLIIMPGGVGDSDSFDKLFKHNKALIQKFVKNGGKYLGICMGAYWADRHYFDLLSNVRAVQYIKQPHTDTRRPHPKAIDITWNKQADKMYFYDGCAFTGSGNYQVVARYANNDPMAIIQNNVGLIGCHPESDLNWYDKPYLLRHWHEYRHDKLLVGFVKKLVLPK